MNWTATLPANIALIKYMGKTDHGSNLPLNDSLSYTLNNFTSSVRLTQSDDEDNFDPLSSKALQLSDKAKLRFISHLKRIKNHFNCSENFTIHSENNFPSSCGLASSASSFAALTEAACLAISDIQNKALPELQQRANLSRQGSGSSCRSLAGPWVKWSGSSIETVPGPWDKLTHQVIVVDSKQKSISSSEAHRLVSTSANFSGRKERANQRLVGFSDAMQNDDWQQAYKIAWNEFSDMHDLFETSSPSFRYLTDDSLYILEHVKTFWHEHNDGPLVTIDAGPNIHLLYCPPQVDIKEHFTQLFTSKFEVLS